MPTLPRVHLARDDVPSTGRIFSGSKDGPLPEGTYTKVWQAARRRGLSRREYASALARRPYDLRHSCVSTWLAAGVDSTQIAAWVGHSVAVLHRVYAHVLPGREHLARKRIAQFLDQSRPRPRPTPLACRRRGRRSRSSFPTPRPDVTAPTAPSQGECHGSPSTSARHRRTPKPASRPPRPNSPS
jgi:hypothetical protein